MHLRSDTRGITLVELIVAVSLLTIVLSCAYYLLFFATKSMKDTEAEFLAEQDARSAAASMEEDIRKSQSAYYGATNHKAIEVYDSWQVMVHTDTDGDGTLEAVTYKLVNDQLKRGEAELGVEPATYPVIADKIRNKQLSPEVPIFTIVNNTVTINLIVTDEYDRLRERPVSVCTMVTVRNKEAMK